MFGIGGQELFFILLLALILLGPSKLPEIAKTMGKMMGEFQRATTDLKKEIDLAAEEPPKKKPETGPEPMKQEAAKPNEKKPDEPQKTSAITNNTDLEPSYRPEDIEG